MTLTNNNSITVVKKQHAIKNNVLINMLCKILFLTDTVEGKRHDKKLADESGYQLPPGSKLGQDTGFQGFSLDTGSPLGKLREKEMEGGGEPKRTNFEVKPDLNHFFAAWIGPGQLNWARVRFPGRGQRSG